MGEGGGGKTYWASLGAIALQGPHQVANQSTTTTGFLAIASLNSSMLRKGKETSQHLFSTAVRLQWDGGAGRVQLYSRRDVVDSHLGQRRVEKSGGAKSEGCGEWQRRSSRGPEELSGDGGGHWQTRVGLNGTSAFRRGGEGAG